MRRDQLEHLIRAAGAILGESQVIVVGSQSIVGAVATVLPAAAVLSIEADLVPFDDDDGRKADLIDGTIGEGSMFEETHGIYADGVGLTTSRLPEGWRDRLRPFRSENTNGVTGWCLDPHDLCAAKLLANRHKDRAFVAALVTAGVVQPTTLADRLARTQATEFERANVVAFLAASNGDPPLQPQ